MSWQGVMIIVNTNHDSNDEDSELIGKFTSFMRILVKDARVDYFRRQKHWDKEVPLDSILNTSDDIFMDSYNDNAEDGFVFDNDLLSDLYSKLPLARRQILVLFFIDGYEPKEIAERLACSVKQVYDQKYITLKIIRDYFMKEGVNRGKH